MTISENFSFIRAKVPPRVTLVAVSKTVEAERIEEAIAAGQRVFGENYVQEARAKWPLLRARHAGLFLHLIGPLQSNKADEAVALFDRIDVLDRPKLAHALAKAMKKTGRRVPLLIEVNIGAEPQKAGCAVAEVPALLELARDVLGLEVRGVMAVPPAGDDPAPFFRQLAALAAGLGLEVVSMGMSADYETAIACGATEVRVGSSLFGARVAR